MNRKFLLLMMTLTGSCLTVHATDALFMALSAVNPVVLDVQNTSDQIVLPSSNGEPVSVENSNEVTLTETMGLLGENSNEAILTGTMGPLGENYIYNPEKMINDVRLDLTNAQWAADAVNQGSVNVSDYDHNRRNIALDLPGDMSSDQVEAAINEEETTREYVGRQAAAVGKYAYDQALAAGKYAGEYVQDPSKVAKNVTRGMAISALTGGMGIAAGPTQWAANMAVGTAGKYLYGKAIEAYEGKNSSSDTSAENGENDSPKSYFDQGKEFVTQKWNNLNIPEMAGELGVNNITSHVAKTGTRYLAGTLL